VKSKSSILFFLLILVSKSLFAQQVYDYVANTQHLGSKIPRPTWMNDIDINVYTTNFPTTENRLFESDGESIFYIMNSVGDATFE